jgi:hypothetical protein
MPPKEINRETLEKLFREVQDLKCKVSKLPTTDIYVNGGSYDPDTMTLTLVDNNGVTPDITIDLSALIPVTLYTGDGVTGTDRTVTVTDTLTIAGPAGMFRLQDGTEGVVGYIWTSIDVNGTGAWIPSPTASTNIYNSDGIITAITRTVQIRTNLFFNHGLAGVNGYFQLTSGGYVRNQTSIATNYWEYNNASGIMSYVTDTHSVTGVRATNGGGVNPESLVELFAGSNSTAYMNIGPTTIRMDFYANNTAILAGSYNSIGDWGFGTLPSAGAKVTIHSASGQGFGTIISSGNLSPAESILQVRNAAAATVLNVSATGRTTIATEAWIGTNTGSISVASPLAVKGYDNLFATRNFGFWNLADDQLFQMQNDGSIGINTAPVVGDRLKITAGGGRDGAINISSNNLANNGYAILAQGGTGGTNYNGIWSDVTGSGAGIARSFYGNSGVAGHSQNFGAYFSARNATDSSVGVFASANGGDAVTPNDFAAGIWGSVGSQKADDRRAGYFSIGQIGDINNTKNYGAKIELSWVSGVTNEEAWGTFIECSVDGAGVTNVAAYFEAAGGGATNYAIITTSGRSIFGNATGSGNTSLIEVYGDLEIMGIVKGIVFEDRTLNTRHRLYLDNGNLLIEAA